MTEQQDPYLYPGTNVLRNKLDIEDPADAKAMEQMRVGLRSRKPPQFDISAEGYQATHKHLFSAVYDWAGKVREVDLSKTSPSGETMEFAPQLAVKYALEKRFDALAREGNLAGQTVDQFAEKAAHHVSELNKIHPFRDGNDRTLTLHLHQLAQRAGHKLDLSGISKEQWDEAGIKAARGDERMLAQVIRNGLIPDIGLAHQLEKQGPPPTQMLTGAQAQAKVAALLPAARREAMLNYERRLDEAALIPGNPVAQSRLDAAQRLMHELRNDQALRNIGNGRGMIAVRADAGASALETIQEIRRAAGGQDLGAPSARPAAPKIRRW
jgi:cell filamentation protein